MIIWLYRRFWFLFAITYILIYTIYMKKVQSYIYDDVNRKMKELSKQDELFIPGQWIVSIRKALGMTQADLANRLLVHVQRVKQLEKSEKKGTLKLSTMQEIASKLWIQFQYGFSHPFGVYNLRLIQATRIARRYVAQLQHTMDLEWQSLSDSKKEEYKKSIIRQLLDEQPPSFWHD